MAVDVDRDYPDQLRAEYLACLLAPDARGARDLIENARAAGVPASTLYLRVISPAMYEVGRLWETAQVSVAQEHLCTQITRAAMAALAMHVTAGALVGEQRVAVVSSSPGEMHALGGQMVSDFLEAQGWTVLNLGADTPVQALVDFVRDQRASLVALSTALSRHLLSVTRTCQLLRQLPEPPFIVAGGQAYLGDPAQALAVGADAFCDDPQALLELLGRQFGRDAQH